MAWETVMGLEVHVELATNKNILFMHNRIRRRAKHSLLPYMHRNAGYFAGC